MKITKLNNREIEIETPVPAKKEIISYERILNDIQMYEEKLTYLQGLKAGADKLNIKR